MNETTRCKERVTINSTVIEDNFPEREYSYKPAPAETHTLPPILCATTSETPTWITPVHNSCVALTIIVIVSKVRWKNS